MWSFTTILNLVVTSTTGLITAKLDSTLGDELKYSTFLFVPIWIFLFCAMVMIPIGGYIFLRGAGWMATLLLYAPVAVLSVFPFIVFFIMLSLRLDHFIDTPFTIVFSPFYAWQFIWFIISSTFAVGYSTGHCKINL